MATYREIQDYILETDGRVVKSCWIAHVKEINGLAPRTAHNRRIAGERVYPRPPEMKLLIEASMHRLGMLQST